MPAEDGGEGSTGGGCCFFLGFGCRTAGGVEAGRLSLAFLELLASMAARCLDDRRLSCCCQPWDWSIPDSASSADDSESSILSESGVRSEKRSARCRPPEGGPVEADIHRSNDDAVSRPLALEDDLEEEGV